MEQYTRLKRLKAENIDVSLSKFKHVIQKIRNMLLIIVTNLNVHNK